MARNSSVDRSVKRMPPLKLDDLYVKLCLFRPDGNKSMRTLYPELAETEDFNDLEDWHIKFVWYIAAKSSPIYQYIGNKKDRIKRALFQCDAERRLSAQNYKEWEQGNYPDFITRASKAMNQYNPASRFLAKKALFDTFTSVLASQQSASSPSSGLLPGDVIKAAKGIEETLQKIIKSMERGFGVAVDVTEDSVAMFESYFDSIKTD